MKKRRISKSPRSRNAYSETLALENSSHESAIGRAEVIKEPKDLMAGLLIKQRGNVRFRLPGTKAVRPRRSLVIDFSKQKDSGTLVSYNSTFTMTGSLPRARSPLWFSQVSDFSWDNPDGNASEDSCQSTLVPTPSGSIDYTQGKTNTSFDYDCRVSSSSAGLPKLLNPMLAPVSNSDKSQRNIEPEDNCDINSGSEVYSDSEEEEEERSSAAISSEEEVERQLEAVCDSESSEFDGNRAVVYKGNRSVSVVQFANDMQINRQAVELSRGISIRDLSRGEGAEDGARRLLKVSIKTLLDIGSGPFQGTLLKPKTSYRGKEISFLRQV